MLENQVSAVKNWFSKARNSQSRLTATRRRRTRRLIVEGLEQRQLMAVLPTLIDLNTNQQSSLHAASASLTIGAITYFVADDGQTGRELWKTDGTEGGTSLVKDIFKGSGDAFDPGTTWLANLNGKLVFNAFDSATFNFGLWSYDVVSDTTTLIDGGSRSNNPSWLTTVGNNVFYSGYSVTTGDQELWKYDGTTTSLVRNIRTSGSSVPENLINVSGTLFFTANDGTNGQELWKSNVVSGVTEIVKNIATGSASSSPGSLTNFNGTLYFSATDSANGRELWKSAGTDATTVVVKSATGISAGTSSSSPGNLTVAGTKLFFTARDTVANGIQLWSTTDGTNANTQIVRNVANISQISNLTNVAGRLYYSATSTYSGGFTDNELWTSDGAATGTGPVELQGGSETPSNFIAVGSTLYFQASGEDGSGAGLWSAVGNTTQLLLDADPTSDDFRGQLIAALGSKLLFSTTSPAVGRELFSSDGTVVGTGLLKDINDANNSSAPSSMVSLGDAVYTIANLGSGLGSSLVKIEGTTRTVLTSNLASPGEMEVSGGLVYFVAGIELWKSDGTVAGTVMVDGATRSSLPRGLTDVNGTLFFVAYGPGPGFTRGEELWKTNGTAAGTTMVRDIRPGSGNSNITSMTNFNGTLYFSADNGTSGEELWRSNGTLAGTNLVNDLSPGSASSSPSRMVVVGDRLYFVANNGLIGREIYYTAGSTVTLLRDLGPGSSNPNLLTNFNGQLAFSAPVSTNGGFSSIWLSNGMDGGTLPISTTSIPVEPTQLVAIGNELFFDSYNRNAGDVELWKFNGTTTALVQNINPNNSSNPTQLTNVGGTLFFTANTQSNGQELFRSDGTDSGTVMVIDINPGTPGSSPNQLLNVNSSLYFSASSPITGRELYVIPRNAAPTIAAPTTVLGFEDTPLVLSFANGGTAIVVNDIEAASTSPLTVTLTATGGVLTLASIAGLTPAVVNATPSITFTGLIADLNNALNGLVYTPASQFNGAATIEVRVNDLGSSGVGGPQETIATVTLSITAVNDAPTIVGPTATIVVNEDTSINFVAGNSITVADIDAAPLPIQVTIATTAGAVSLSLATIADLTFTVGDGVSDATMTFSGSSTAINAALSNSLFVPTANLTGARTVVFTVNDLGNTGSGGAKSATRTVSISLIAQNDAPVNTTPAPQSMVEGTTLAFSSANGNLITVADVDRTTGVMLMSISSSVGTITLSRTNGLGFTGGTQNGTGLMTFAGTLVNVNNALANAIFNPVNAEFSGSAAVVISSNDQGGSGAGGSRTTVSTITVNVTGVNDAPVITIPATQLTNEDTAISFSAATSNLISIADPDAFSNNIQVTLIGVNGMLTLNSTTQASFVFTDTLANINSRISNLTFMPSANFNGLAGIQLLVNDLGNTGGPANLVSSFVTVNVSAVNDAPVNTAPRVQSTNEDATLTFTAANNNAIEVSDVDGIAASVTLVSVKGATTLSGIVGLTFTSGDGIADATMSFSGSISAINTALAGLQFRPTKNATGLGSLVITTNDNGASGSGGALTSSSTVNITVQAINDAPVFTAPTTAATANNTPLIFGPNIIKITDVDAGTNLIHFTLSVTNGTFTFGSLTGLTFLSGGGTNSSSALVSGTLADINAALNGLTFVRTAGFVGVASLNLSVNDLGNAGLGGAKSASSVINVNVTA